MGKAEAAVEEKYTVEIEVEVEDDEDTEASSNETSSSEDKDGSEEKSNETATDDEKKDDEKKDDEKKDDEKKSEENAESQNDTSTEESASEEKEEPKKKKTKLVEKERKRTHKKTLDVDSYNVGKIQPLSKELIEEYKSNIEHLAELDRKRVLLEEAKNKLESYFYHVKNKLLDDEENIAKISTEEQREELMKLSRDAEDWLFDEGDTADLETIEAKYDELAIPAEKVWFRLN